MVWGPFCGEIAHIRAVGGSSFARRELNGLAAAEKDDFLFFLLAFCFPMRKIVIGSWDFFSIEWTLCLLSGLLDTLPVPDRKAHGVAVR